MQRLQPLLFRRQRRYAELAASIREHLEERVDDLMEQGVPREEAEQRARREFGSVTQVEERSREVWQWPRVESLWADVRFALRQLRRSPGYALTVVLTLAIGIGANLAVFGLLHGVLFARLAVPRPAELYALQAVRSPFDAQWIYSTPAFERLRQATGGTAPVIARSGFGSGVLRTGASFSEEASLQMVSGNFFSVLGVAPASGRLLAPGDDTTSQPELPVVLRYGFARQKFGGTTSVLGMRAMLNQVPIVVVGVAPDRFSGVVQGTAPDLWLPLSAQRTGRFTTWFDSLGPGFGIDLHAPYQNQQGLFWLWLLARVPDAAKPTAAARWTAALQSDLHLIASATRDGSARARILGAPVQLVPVPGGEGALGERYSRPLLLMMVMAALLFCTGCMNLVNLQLARLFARQRELAMRLCLGASRWRVLRQLLVEDALLLVLGGSAASLAGGGLSAVLLRWLSGRDRLLPIDLHFGVLSWLLGLGLLVTAMVACSLLPALAVTRNATAVMKRNGAGRAVHAGAAGPAMAGRSGRALATALLAGQVSLSLLLLSMAFLFGQTLRNLGTLDAGLDREHVLTVHLDLAAGDENKQDMAGREQRLLDQLRALPFVRSAAMQMCRVPDCIWNTAIHVAGSPELAEAAMHGEENHVSAGFFTTLGIPLLRGRVFDTGDRRGSQPVAILNRAYARQLFGDEDPIGHFIGYKPAPDDHVYRVVGEVGDARVDGLRRPAPPVAYFSLEQGTEPAANIEVRASGPPAGIASAVRQSLLTADPGLPIAEIVPLSIEFDDGLATETLLARLTAIFAALTLALAAVGFYGLLSFHVVRRTAEIGVRMAVGATRGQVLALFLRQAVMIVVLGAVPGVLLGALGGHLARTLLYGVGRGGLWASLVAGGVLLAVGLLATLMPARRASQLDPQQALRAE